MICRPASRPPASSPPEGAPGETPGVEAHLAAGYQQPSVWAPRGACLPAERSRRLMGHWLGTSVVPKSRMQMDLNTSNEFLTSHLHESRGWSRHRRGMNLGTPDLFPEQREGTGQHQLPRSPAIKSRL